MKTAILCAAALSAALLSGGASAAPAVTGDYVEARSANIFVGACHREGELLTAGRNAVMAWNIAEGEHQGVSLKGVAAVAVVAGDKYLSFEDARRQSVLYVAESATPAQREALASLLKERAGKALGDLVAVKSAPIRFDARGDLYRVNVDGVAQLKVKKQTAELCCKQPYQLWGSPFVPVKDAKAGYGVSVEYRDSGLLKAWSATDQNNAFFGQFSL